MATRTREGAPAVPAPQGSIDEEGLGLGLDDPSTQTWVLGGGVCVTPLPTVVLAQTGLTTILSTRSCGRVGLWGPGRPRELATL